MSARVQGLILGLGKAKQVDIATASASFLRFKEIDTTLTSPHPVTENDAAEIGKGNEFIGAVYPVSYDAVGKAAPKLTESAVAIGKSVDGIAADVHSATTDFVKPKTFGQKFRSWLETAGKLAARFL